MQSRRLFLKSAALLPFASNLLSRDALAQQPASPSQPKWLKDIAEQLRNEFNLPAVWLAVSTEERIEAAVVGVKKIGDPTPATLDDNLTVASISKPMAGLWMASLVDRGIVTYEATVIDVLPELKLVCLPEHRTVSLGQLLTHTAGVIRDVGNLPNNLKLSQFPAERLRQAREVLSTPSPPGSKGKGVYSNNGVTLAATMAERVAGVAYEEGAGNLYRERLGLKSWGVWQMDMHDDLSSPWPHSMNANTAMPQPPRSVQFQFVRPSGSAHCTISDLVRFGLIATGAAKVSRTLLKPSTWTSIMSPIPGTSTALSCFSADGERGIFSHSGSLGTTSSNLVVFPQWQISCAIHTNASADDFRDRGMALLQDAIRKQRAMRNPPAPCSIALTGVATVDTTWQSVIVPKITDDKIRIRVQFRIDVGERTGDLQTLVKLGDVERRDDRFKGLASGNHTLHFEFDTPKATTTSAVIRVDSLGTAGNRLPKATLFEATLTLQ